jgi:PAS domain-containing protein
MCEGQLVYQLGLTPEEIVGKDLREIVPDEYANWKIQFYQKAWKCEITYYEAEFNDVDYCFSLMPVFNGKVFEVIGSGIDITERKSIDRIKERYRDWYRNIFNGMSESVVLYCGKDGFTAFNDNVFKLFGVERGEIITEILQNRIRIYKNGWLKINTRRISNSYYVRHRSNTEWRNYWFEEKGSGDVAKCEYKAH